jgi:DNA-binding FadR family transcriptional regulator
MCRPRTLALTLVEGLGERIRDGRLRPGDKLPTEAAIRVEFGVSRTVVREAISKLQASGLVRTRHGVGTFVEDLGPAGGEGAGFRIDPAQMATLHDVVAVLELRIGVETEAAGLAAQRRSSAQLEVLRLALEAVGSAVEAGDSAVVADVEFHLAISRATANPHFVALMSALGPSLIPRARLAPPAAQTDAERLSYLRRVQVEHESIVDAIAAQDPDAARAAMRTHLANSRERRRRAAARAAGDGV